MILQPAWLVPGDISESMINIANNPLLMRANILVDVLTALGIVFTIVHIGSVGSPPLGNSLESIGQGAPFFFWASLSIAALVTLSFIKETGWRRVKNVTSEQAI